MELFEFGLQKLDGFFSADALKQLEMFGQRGSGGIYTIWKQVDGRRPVVYLCDEGDNLVVAPSFYVFAMLLGVAAARRRSVQEFSSEYLSPVAAVLLFTLAGAWGAWPALAVTAALYALAHLHKPMMGETLGSLPMGFLFGAMCLATGSFVPAFLLHLAIAGTTETSAST